MALFLARGMTAREPTAGVPTRTFLRAEWRDLLMVNYAIDPRILEAFVPVGTELDCHEGATFVSLVAFRFLETRVLSVAVPFHRNFDEVNLRFYVRRRTAEGWRRGVVFLREYVPRPAIAWIARLVYGEPYRVAHMRHEITRERGVQVRYEWKAAGRWNVLGASGVGEPQPIAPGSLEEFITEHYWGYTKRRAGSSEYEVEHPRWRIWPAEQTVVECAVAALYGAAFVEPLAAPPASAFIAEGSPVSVRAWRRAG